MLNRIAIVILVIGVAMTGWSSWKWYASSSGVIHDSEKAQSISENWNRTSVDEVFKTREEPKVAASDSDETPPPEENGNETKEYSYENGDEIGKLVIPKLENIYEVYWGTDDKTLDRGVGYHEGDFTTPPDGLGHTVLSGHRDTVFRELGDLEEGDRLYVEFESQIYEYQIRDIWITDAEDRSVIVDKDSPTLTLTTCYPFSFIGAAPDRYIIEAELTNIEQKDENTGEAHLN